MKVIIILSCLIVTSVAAKEKSEKLILCGRQLANYRVTLCYDEKSEEKRTFSDSMLEKLGSEDSWSDDNWIEYWPWKGRRGVLSAGWERYKRVGLADECCLKGCNIDVIRSYC